eukprot:364441-Chlamydomonas_euryale.AAC.8
MERLRPRSTRSSSDADSSARWLSGGTDSSVDSAVPCRKPGMAGWDRGQVCVCVGGAMGGSAAGPTRATKPTRALTAQRRKRTNGKGG